MSFDNFKKNRKQLIMKTKSTLFVLVIFSIILSQSCSVSKNILKLQPEDKDNGKWLYGQQFIADSINGIIYETSFERCQDEQYWFNFTVTNRSNLPILIDPMEFRLQAYDGYHKLVKESFALNPENEILDIEISLAKANAREANHLGLSLLAASIDIATGIATATDDNPDNDFLRTNIFEATQVGREVNAFYTDDLKTMKDSWENSTIRKTTLEPNYNIQGKVFFPAVREASYIKLLLPVDTNFVELSFIQLQFPVNH